MRFVFWMEVFEIVLLFYDNLRELNQLYVFHLDIDHQSISGLTKIVLPSLDPGSGLAALRNT